MEVAFALVIGVYIGVHWGITLERLYRKRYGSTGQETPNG